MKITHDVTLCIPTVNRPAELAVALSSVLGQTIKPYRVLVALDGNDEQQAAIEQDGLVDNVRIALEANGVQCKFVVNPGPHGIGQNKNHYLNFIESEWFLQLEDDAWLSPDYIERLVSTPAFAKRHTAGLAGVQLLPKLPNRAGWSDHDLTEQHEAPRLFNAMSISESGVHFLNKGQVYRYSPEILEHRPEIPAMCFIHTYLLRTARVKSIGGWDLTFSDPAKSFAFEEIDTTYSLWMKGFDLFVIPAAVMWHFRSSNRSIEWRYDASKVLDGYKHNEGLFVNKWLGRKRNT